MPNSDPPLIAGKNRKAESSNARTLNLMLRWALLTVIGVGIFAVGGLFSTNTETQKILTEIKANSEKELKATSATKPATDINDYQPVSAVACVTTLKDSNNNLTGYDVLVYVAGGLKEGSVRLITRQDDKTEITSPAENQLKAIAKQRALFETKISLKTAVPNKTPVPKPSILLIDYKNLKMKPNHLLITATACTT